MTPATSSGLSKRETKTGTQKIQSGTKKIAFFKFMSVLKKISHDSTLQGKEMKGGSKRLGIVSTKKTKNDFHWVFSPAATKGTSILAYFLAK